MIEQLVTPSGSAPENLFIELFRTLSVLKRRRFFIRSTTSPTFIRTTAMPISFLKTAESVSLLR